MSRLARHFSGGPETDSQLSCFNNHSAKQREDWGKKGLIPKNVKRKYLHPCPPFFLSAVFLAR